MNITVKFEVGFLVTLKDKESQSVFKVCVIKQIFDDEILVVDCRNLPRYFKKSDIKTIRRPRPGNAESRLIVAMILTEYRKEVRDYIFRGCGFERTKDNDAIKAAYNRWKLTTPYFLYKKAKSMLITE